MKHKHPCVFCSLNYRKPHRRILTIEAMLMLDQDDGKVYYIPIKEKKP